MADLSPHLVGRDMVRGVIDTHIHLWDRRRHEYPWLNRWPHIGTRVDATVLGQAVAGLAGAVFVEAGVSPDDAAAELRWLADQAALCDFPVRVVAHQLPGDPCWWMNRPGADLVAGVRQVMHVARAGEIANPDFVADACEAGEAGRVVDLTVRPEQLDEVAHLCGQAPDTWFVLDHLGSPWPSADGFDHWATAVAGVAAHPNVVCKLSTRALRSDEPGGADTAARYVARALDLFGADRCVFGTCWPVLTHACSYKSWLDLVLSVLDDAGHAERQAVLAGNARRIYGFPAHSARANRLHLVGGAP
ncbi:amidohydrolase family protein [Actinokineospora sp. HUAS TT18]|uniref:amidohydrolase family protein n=1 Tax=Actinokineospora sp. HUAS TT18 TaxID=3447451 RepID=UPI003F51E582